MVQARSISRHLRMNLRLVLQAVSLIAAAVAMTSATVGCGQENPQPNGNGNVVAVTALSNCAAGATYQGNAWERTPYGRINATPYGFGVRNFQPNPLSIRNEGFCGCAAGTQPMCDSQTGIICIPTDVMSGADLALWQPGPQGLNFSGYAGYTAYGNIGDRRAERRLTRRRHDAREQIAIVRVARSNQCASHIGQTCAVGTNSCGQGSVCRPFAVDQPLGICAR